MLNSSARPIMAIDRDAGHEDFEQRDPTFVGEAEAGAEGVGLTMPEETPLARRARRKGRCGQEPPSP